MINRKAEVIRTIASVDHYVIFIGNVDISCFPILFVNIGLAITKSGVVLKVEKKPINEIAKNKNVLISKLLHIVTLSFLESGTVTTSEYFGNRAN